jgi:toxin ParE1/3/4
MNLEIHPEARAEYMLSIDWHVDERSRARADQFVAAVALAFESLRSGEAFSSWAPHVSRELGARRVLVEDFEYHVIFIERVSFQAIVAVAHFKREPGYWEPRVKDYPAR